jgi:endonuclease/exonuclease/phosphatase (EEP) superfamily protein YafD
MIPLILITIAASATIAGFFSEFNHYLDIASHFRLQYLALLLLCLLLCLLRKQWKLFFAAAVFALINLTLILPFYFPNPLNANFDEDTKLSILLMNLNSANQNYEKVVNYIDQMRPDILALEEFNDNWLSHLNEVLKEYPFRKDLTRRDGFGIGLYSKLKTDRLNIKYYGEAGIPSVLADYRLNDRQVSLIITHPVPPATAEHFRLRNSQFDAMINDRANLAKKIILVGDLNTTSWSYHFQELLRKMELKDSRKGFGLQTTWPAMLPVMGITIDHVLISDDIKVIKRRTGPFIGSDHLPVYIELAL